ncbi:MAG: CHAT domain-containing protein [Cytophagaceae bacterium]
MKKSGIILFLIHSYALVCAQSTATWRNKTTERKLAFIEYKYTSGEYQEAVQESKTWLSKAEKNSSVPAIYIVRAKIDQAYAHYAALQFDKANSACQEASLLNEQSSDVESKFNGLLLIAGYKTETGDLISALNDLSKAENLLSSAGSETKSFDLTFLKAKILIKKGFVHEPLKLLSQQEDYRLEMASGLNVNVEQSMAVDQKYDYMLRKEKYAELAHLKIIALISSGSFEQAEFLISKNKAWLSSNLGAAHPLYREMQERSAEICMLKHEYDKASYLYSEAYVATSFPDYEQNKISNLSQLIIASAYAGQKVKFKNYLRRLEMYAFRNLGFIDPFQLAYEYSASYNSFIEGDFTEADSRLMRLKSNFSFLPSFHPMAIAMEELTASIALKSGDLKKQNESLTRLSEIKRKYYGEDAPAFHAAQLSLALFEIHYGKDFGKAERIFSNSYTAIVKKEIMKESLANMFYLSAYAELFGKTDRYDSAMVNAQEAKAIARTLYSENSAEYLLEFSVFIEYQILSGKYKEGFENLEKAFNLSDEIKDGDPAFLQRSYMIVARLLSMKGDFERSQALLDKAYKLSLGGYEKQLLAEAETLEELASLYLQTGSYYRAEKALMKSLLIKEQKLEKSSPLLIHTYQELARLNLLNGNYTVGEQYLKKASGISSEVFGRNSLIFAECQLIYSEYYLSIGDFKKAGVACNEAGEIELKILGPGNLKRAEILSRLAFIRSKIPTYNSNEIEDLYSEAAGLIKEALGADNPLYINLIQKQAQFYISINNPDKSDILLNEAEKFWIAKLGGNNKYVAEIILLRGDVAYSKSSYELAEQNYNKARNLYGSVFNENHPLYIQASGKLARVYYMQKHTDKALAIMDDIIPKYLDYITKYFPSLSFKEKKKFWNNIKDEFDFYNFIAVSVYQKEKPKLSGRVYDNIISTKALLLNSDIKVRRSIISSKDSVLIGYYNEWVAQKEYLTNALSLTRQQLADQNIDMRLIEGRIETLEKEINKHSELFSAQEKQQELSWRSIAASLKENEYAVEILRCRHFNKIFTDTVIYAGLVISAKTNDHPDMVIFPEGNAMEKKYFKYYRNAAIQKVDDKYSYNAYWKPVKSIIPDGATIYLSSDGVYNQLNVEMMQESEGPFVLDQNQIVALTNTKDLLFRAVPEKKKAIRENRKEVTGTYVLCGNPDFYSGKKEIDHKTLAALPGAEKELLDINTLLAAAGKPTLTYLNAFITEDTLLYLRDPKVFHIATHGYFREPSGSEEDDLASDPLLNSGLILYGGGDIVNDPENTFVNSKAGVLTAYEATNLHFDNTELVVLSACETGRGEVQAGEGVYGLQRSFLIAGADAVVMSLFKVNDEVTQKLMLSFYDKWLKTGDKRKSFADAKKEIKRDYGSAIYWGVFVMVEGKPQDILLSHP